MWSRPSGQYGVRFWRDPLASLTGAATGAGFLIRGILEPLPAPEMEKAAPDDWAQLHTQPGFLVLDLLKPHGV